MTQITNHSIEAKLNYAKVHRPGNKYKSEEKEYSVDAILNSEQAKELTDLFSKHDVSLEAFGKPRIKDLGDGNFCFKFKRDEFNKEGKEASIDVKVLDENGKLVDLPKNILIGNGSSAVVHFMLIQLDGGSSIVRLKGVQLLDLVPYVPDASDSGMQANKSGQTLTQMQAQVAIAINENNEASPVSSSSSANQSNPF